MEKLPRRQLTAILFADIVGYTALMQSDEQQALSNLQKFKIAIEQLVPQNNGAIIQYYGDACLATFNSSADAANCAIQLQADFQQSPKVPVRIGLHSGEVVFKEGNVFGDAVNIASRIESMGVPGTVLLSSSVRKQIKNQAQFNLAPLGKFEFKNVEEAVTIYALANDHLVVPQKEALKGKFKVEKTAVPTKSNKNTLVIAGLAVALVAALAYIFTPAFGQATTKEISIINEAGEAEMRMVPTAEFSRKFVSFPFEVDLDSEEADWLSVALPVLFNNDLEQDMRLSGISPVALKEEYDLYNQTFPNPIPFATQVKVAQDYFTDYFMSGKITQGKNSQYQLDVSVNETETGKVFTELTAEGNDLFSLIDQLTVQLNEQLYLPDAQSSQMRMIDLPVKELVTANNDALKSLIQGKILATKNPQAGPAAIDLLKKSTELDPNCADCFSFLAQLQFAFNEQEAALATINQASLLAESQPERKKMQIRGYQLNVEQEFDKMFQLYENWRQLYPNDLTPYSRLMMFYSVFNQYDKAKKVGHAAIANGHRGRFMTQLAKVYIKTQEYETAEKLLTEFAQLYPNKANKTYELADIYIAQGKLEKALQFYENLMVMGGNDPKAVLSISDIQDRLGQFTAAEKTLTDYLAKARLAQDSMRTYEYLENHFIRLGQYAPFFKNFQQRLAINQRIAPPITKINIVFNRLQTFVHFDKVGLAYQYVREIEQEIPAFKTIINCFGDFLINMQTDDLAKFNAVANSEICKPELIKNFMAGAGEEMFDALVALVNEDYDQAAAKMDSVQAKKGTTGLEFEEGIVDIYRLSKNFAKANKLLDDLLQTDPNNPVFLLAGAQLRFDEGELETATEILQKVLAIWSEADATYKPYQEAVELGRDKLGLPL
ncbi:MAG: adenylate/guanylate cyclase domain-containing protein [Bacteroidota bacterium]